MRKSIAAAGITASLLTGSFVGAALLPSGVSFAQEATDDAAPADDAGTGEHQRGAWVADTIAQLVADGTINQTQGDAVLAALEENRPERPFGGHHDGPRLETLSELLGIEADDIVTQLRDGATLAEIATANGVEVQALIDGLVAEAEEHLAQAVTDGKLTQEKADEISATLVERITARVNGEAPEGGPGFGPGGRPGRGGPFGEGRPFGGEAPADAETGA